MRIKLAIMLGITFCFLQIAISADNNYIVKDTTPSLNQDSVVENVMSKNEIQLIAPVLKSSMTLEECIATRRSKRDFQEKDLSLEQISQILWAGQGITGKEGKRATPSAGGIYPVELYVVISSGIYHFNSKENNIVRVATGSFKNNLSDVCLGQAYVAQSGMTIIITAAYKKMTWKYGTKGIRFVDMEAGHIAQNIQLQSQSLGLASVPIGTFDDKRMKEILSLPQELQPIYIVSIGYPK